MTHRRAAAQEADASGLSGSGSSRHARPGTEKQLADKVYANSKSTV